jgi:hypothetical protein
MSFLRTRDKRKHRVSPEDVLRQLEQSQSVQENAAAAEAQGASKTPVETRRVAQ